MKINKMWGAIKLEFKTDHFFLYFCVDMEDVPGPSSAPYFSQRRSTENFSRLCQLIMTICSDLFRTILSQYIKPENLRKELDNNRTSLEEILNYAQKNLLYPPASQSKYLVSSDLDFSILYILLRNICNIPKHKKGWGKPPKSGDKCLAACIEESDSTEIWFRVILLKGRSMTLFSKTFGRNSVAI